MSYQITAKNGNFTSSQNGFGFEVFNKKGQSFAEKEHFRKLQEQQDLFIYNQEIDKLNTQYKKELENLPLFFHDSLPENLVERRIISQDELIEQIGEDKFKKFTKKKNESLLTRLKEHLQSIIDKK